MLCSRRAVKIFSGLVSLQDRRSNKEAQRYIMAVLSGMDEPLETELQSIESLLGGRDSMVGGNAGRDAANITYLKRDHRR